MSAQVSFLRRLPACGADSAFVKDNSEDDTLQIGQSRAHAHGANGGKPIFGGTTKALERAATIESTSEEDITPIRNGRRARGAPTTLSDEEDSDHRVAPVPVTPRRYSRTHWPLPTRASSPSSETGVDSPNRQLSQKLSMSPESQPNANQSTPKRSHFDAHDPRQTPEPLIISSGNGEDSSDDDIMTPARRRRNAANFETTTQRDSSKGEDVREMDDDVADLSDTGESMLAKGWANSRKL